MTTRPLRRLAPAMLLYALLGGVASAQTSSAPDGEPDPKTTIPEKFAPQDRPTTDAVGPSEENTSEKLHRNEGVLKPPENIDPEMTKPPPQGGRTPVIPPPGSPGGDPTLRPK